MDNVCEVSRTRNNESVNRTRNDESVNRTRNNESQEQRDDEGRYRKGNKGGPGNPFARQVALLRKAALEAVSESDIRDIMNAMKEKVLAGDIAAAKLVLAYGAGKPTPPADPDTLDQHEFRTQVNNTLHNGDGMVSIVQGLPLDMVLKMVRAMLPALEESKRQLVGAMLKPPTPASDEGDMDDATDHENGEEQGDNETASQEQSVLPDYLQEIVDRDTMTGEQATESSGRKQRTGGMELAELRVLAEQVSELREILEQMVEQQKEVTMDGGAGMVHAEGNGGPASGLVGALAARRERITNGSISG